MIAEADILESTYFDKCDIIRVVKTVDNETGISTKGEKVVYKDVPCAVSARDSLREVLTGEVATVKVISKLFLHPKYEIVMGDMVKVTHFNNKVKTYLASNPFFYHSHSETPIDLKERS